MKKKLPKILVINPGTTSTKVAVFSGSEEVDGKNIEYTADDVPDYDLVFRQFDLRRKGIEEWLAILPPSDRTFDAIAARGAPLKPLEGGTYAISEEMLEDVKSSKYSNHASNLGPLLADYFSRLYKIPAYITDPVTVDNFSDEARISGLPEIVRKCRSHALNIKAIGRAEATRIGKKPEELNFIVAHMGNGISVAVLKRGLIVEVNDALLGMGPFSPERAGALPVGPLVELCFSGKYEKDELLAKLSKKSGLMGYLGINDLRAVEQMIEDGDSKAELIFNAMCYQIAKEIGASGAVLKGKIDSIILTGGLAYSQRLTYNISSYIGFLAPIRVLPGEQEMNALAEGALRVLSGEERIKRYE